MPLLGKGHPAVDGCAPPQPSLLVPPQIRSGGFCLRDRGAREVPKQLDLEPVIVRRKANLFDYGLSAVTLLARPKLMHLLVQCRHERGPHQVTL